MRKKKRKKLAQFFYDSLLVFNREKYFIRNNQILSINIKAIVNNFYFKWNDGISDNDKRAEYFRVFFKHGGRLVVWETNG